MNLQEVQATLKVIGFVQVGKCDGVDGPATRAAIKAFQEGYAFSDLVVDGIAGPKTKRALKTSMSKDGACSKNFKFREFASRGNKHILVHRELVRGLEAYRKLIGGSVTIINGHRDPAYNASPRVRGAKNSQHLYGTAADIPKRATLSEVRALGVFSGIGYRVVDGVKLVSHVDVRHVGKSNPNKSTVKRPAVWSYSK